MDNAQDKVGDVFDYVLKRYIFSVEQITKPKNFSAHLMKILVRVYLNIDIF